MKKTFYAIIFGLVALVGIATIPSSVSADSGNARDRDTNNKKGDITAGTSLQGDTSKDDDLFKAAKNFINWMLGILAMIAMVICLWAGFQMMTAAGDEAKYKKGFDILKRAGVGLIVIGLAWMIVSVVMWLITKLTSAQ